MRIELTPEQRQYLKGLAHALNPVVMIGNNGLSEIAVNLDAHELIKVRVHGDDREVRAALYGQICDDLDAAPVQMIGKLLVIYRPSDKQRISLPSGRKKPAA